jgi:hypothetical protein
VRLSPGALYTANFTPPTSFGGGPPQTVVQLGWQAPASGPPAGYNVYRQVDGGVFTQLNSTLVKQPSWTDTQPPQGALCYQVTAVDGLSQEGDASTPTCTQLAGPTKAQRASESPTAVRLDAGPNPFNPTTTLSFVLATRERVHLAIYDVRGHRVATLLDEHRDPGPHHVVWDGHDAQGARVASGTYFVTLDAGGVHLRRRIVMVK